MPASIWLILAIALCVCEIFTLNFSLLCFGLACLVSAAASWLGFNIIAQLIVFTAAIFVMFFYVRPFFLRVLDKAKETKSNVDALIGKTVVVVKVNKKETRKGLAKIDADEWTLSSREPLSEGCKVKITKVDGTTLIVESDKEK